MKVICKCCHKGFDYDMYMGLCPKCGRVYRRGKGVYSAVEKDMVGDYHLHADEGGLNRGIQGVVYNQASGSEKSILNRNNSDTSGVSNAINKVQNNLDQLDDLMDNMYRNATRTAGAAQAGNAGRTQGAASGNAGGVQRAATRTAAGTQWAAAGNATGVQGSVVRPTGNAQRPQPGANPYASRHPHMDSDEPETLFQAIKNNNNYYSPNHKTKINQPVVNKKNNAGSVGLIVFIIIIVMSILSTIMD